MMARRQLPVALLAGVILLMTALASPVAAQSGDGLFAEPITTSELSKMWKALRASPDQQDAMLRMHESYRMQFDALRDDVLDEAARRFAALQEPRMPEPAVVRTVTRLIDSGRLRIAALDDALFVGIESVLAEEQVAGIMRLRSSRERRRLLASIPPGTLNNIRIVELSEILAAAGIDEEHPNYEAIDAIVASAEDRLSGDLRQLARMTSSLLPDAFQVLTAAGAEPGTDFLTGGPETAPYRRVLSEFLAERAHAQSGVIRRVIAGIRQSGSRIADHLDPPLAQHMRRAVTGALYHRIDVGILRYGGIPDFPFHLESWAAELEGAPGERVRAAIAEHLPHIDRLIGEMADTLDSQVAASNPAAFDEESFMTMDRRFSSLMRDATAHQQKIIDVIQKEAGGTWHHALMRRAARPAPAPITRDGEEDATAMTAPAYTGDWALPAPLGARDRAVIGSLLELRPDERPPVDQLLSDYENAFRALGDIEDVRSLTQRARTNIDEAAEITRQLRAARRRAVHAVAALEAQFFDDLAAAVGTPERAPVIALVRQCREAELLARRGFIWVAPRAGGDTAGRFIHPLHLLMRERGLTDAQRRAAAVAAADQIARLAPVAHRLFDHALHVQAIQDEWRFTAPGDGSPDFNERRSTAAKPAAAMFDADLALQELLADIAGEMMRALPGESGRMFLERFRRAAWPEIYDRLPDIGILIERALRLQDITPSQREALTELLLPWREEFEASGAHLVELNRTLHRRQIELLASDPDESRELHLDMADLRRDIDHTDRNRRDATARTLLRLRTALSEEQAAVIGPIPDPATISGG